MRFALNYSPAAARLFSAGMIRLDLFKTPDFPDMIADARRYGPIYVHFPLESGPNANPDLQAVRAMRTDTHTPYVNTHLVTRRKDFPTLDGHSDSPTDLAPATARILADLRHLTQTFGPHTVIAENLIYLGKAHDDYLRPAVTPSLITHVIEQSHCGLLLDLSHARIAAHYLGVDPKRYIQSLPLHALKELHITGLAMHKGILTDHMPLTDEDWQFAKWALIEIRHKHWNTPDIVALEYGGAGPPFAWRTDPAVLAAQVPRLYDMVHDQ